MRDKFMDNLPEYYSISDICRILHITRATAYRLLKTDGFPAVTIGNFTRINREAFNQWQLDHLQTTVVLPKHTTNS